MKIKDLKIGVLNILVDDSTIDRDTLAAMVGTDRETVDRIIQELEDDRVILKYTTVVDWERINAESTVYARIDVQVQPQREVGFDDIARRICRFPEVKSMMLVSGKFDFAVMVEAPTMMGVSNFVSGKLATIDGVKSTWTNFILKKYKENEVMYGDEDIDNRQVVTL